MECKNKLRNNRVIYCFKKNILLVRYENLISNPQIYFKKICNFIDEDFESDMIRGKKRSEAKRSKQWENVSKDVMKNNKKKYIAELNKREIKIIEKKCAFEMKFLGYDFEFEKNNLKLGLFEKMFYETYEKINRISISYEDKEEGKIRKKRNQLRNEIKKIKI